MRYSPALDGLRAIAIAVVVLFHARVPLAWGGFLGVDVFFVLSGFLISSLLLAELDATGTVGLRAFYMRRLVRLTPALLLMLAVYSAIAPLAWPEDSHANQVAIAAAYVSDYVIALAGTPPGQLSHTWSLSVEMHFYLLAPIALLWAARRFSTRRLLAAAALLYVAATCWRLVMLAAGQSWQEVYYRFDTHLSGLVLGCLLSLLVRDPGALYAVRRRLPSLRFWLPVLVLAFCILPWGNRAVAAIGFTAVELGTAALLLAVQDKDSAAVRLLSHTALVWVGKMSYGIYLWHYPVFRLLREDLPWHQVLLLGVPLSVALAALSFYTIEAWARRLRLSRRLLGPDRVKA